jgi:hypothetical protein
MNKPAQAFAKAIDNTYRQHSNVRCHHLVDGDPKESPIDVSHPYLV